MSVSLYGDMEGPSDEALEFSYCPRGEAAGMEAAAQRPGPLPSPRAPQLALGLVLEGLPSLLEPQMRCQNPLGRVLMWLAHEQTDVEEKVRDGSRAGAGRDRGPDSQLRSAPAS